MELDHIIAQGNTYREQTEPENALACYAQALIAYPDSAAAFNNYGNTLRELGRPDRAIPFLEHAAILDPSMSTAHFNLAVSLLLNGDLKRGLQQYESRWNFEHLAGTLPNFTQPRWAGQDLKDKTIFVIGEQGHGDNIQFVRFLPWLRDRGARVIFQVGAELVDLLHSSNAMAGIQVDPYGVVPEHFDYWSPVMSLPAGLGISYKDLNSPLQYLTPSATQISTWHTRLGLKTKQRIGICWSGRRDTWINKHKSVSFDQVTNLILRNPDFEWINLQADADQAQYNTLSELGVHQYPGTVQTWNDTAGLIHHLDLVIGVDTAISHLAGAMGRPTWIMLNQYALDWRWLLNRADSPWYPSAKLFRQPVRGDWSSVVNQLCQYLSWWKN